MTKSLQPKVMTMTEKSPQPMASSMTKSPQPQALSTQTLNTPPLITQDCLDCQAEGYTLAFAGLTEEHPLVCLSCNGQGTIDVCSACCSPLSIVKGFEVCSCLVIEQAA